MRWVGENFVRRTVFDQLAEAEERRAVADSGGLLHIVRDDTDRVGFAQHTNEFLDFAGGDRIKGTARFVHEQDFRRRRQRAGDAEPLLLAAGKRQSRFFQVVPDLVPQRRRDERLFDDFIELYAVADALQSRPVGYVVVNALGKRVRTLKDHADNSPQLHEVDARVVDVLPFDKELPFGPHSGNQVVHAVDASQKRTFPATARSDDGRHGVAHDVHADFFDAGFPAVVKREIPRRDNGCQWLGNDVRVDIERVHDNTSHHRRTVFGWDC